MKSRLSSCFPSRLAVACAAILAAILPAGSALAQAWPSRHISMIVPFAAGSSSDAIGRIMAQRMSELLGQQIVVENVGGAGGMVGSARVARSEPNGYTILLGSTDTLAQNQTLYKSPQYNPITDFAPIGLVGDMALILVARNSLPVDNLKEFAAYVKANGKTMQFGSSSLGSSSHLTCSQLTQAIGAEAAHVPYRGSGPALQDMIAGQIDYFCSLAPAAMPIVDNKQIKLLAVLTKSRSPFAPTVPTAFEEGFKIDSYAWFALAAAKATPPEIVAALNKATVDALDTPWVQDRFQKLSVSGAAKEKRSAEWLGKFIEQEVADWAVVIKASGVVLN